MDGISLKIVTGNRKALALAKTMLTTPTLINIDPTQGAIYAIPLDVETDMEDAAAEVSESLVISTDSKKFMSDNVAPGSKSWSLSGYLKGIPRLEPTNYFQPFVLLHKDILRNWFKNGAVLIYKDGDSRIHPNVVIKNLKLVRQKECANAAPFSLGLKEINVMETSTADLPDDVNGDPNKIAKSLPAVGSALGKPLALGMTAAMTAVQNA